MSDGIKSLKIGNIITAPNLRGKYIVIGINQERMPGPHNEPSFLAWMVKLQKLSNDGTYNHKARIKFMYEDRIFTDEARLDEFSVVGRMKKIKKEIKTKIDYFV